MPVVLRITSKRTFTTRRIIQHIVSVPSSGQSITILSIFRQVRSAETFLEFEDREFANIVLKSQQQKPFPFDITLSSNITHPIQSSLGIWLSEGASIHLRLDFDRRDKEDIVSGHWFPRSRSKASPQSTNSSRCDPTRMSPQKTWTGSWLGIGRKYSKQEITKKLFSPE